MCDAGGQTGRSDTHLIIPPSDRGHTPILETQTHTDMMESDWKDGKLKGEEDEGDTGEGKTGGQKKKREARRMREELPGRKQLWVSHFNPCRFQFSANTLQFSRDHGEEKEEMTNMLKKEREEGRGKRKEVDRGSGRKGEEGRGIRKGRGRKG